MWGCIGIAPIRLALLFSSLIYFNDFIVTVSLQPESWYPHQCILQQWKYTIFTIKLKINIYTFLRCFFIVRYLRVAYFEKKRSKLVLKIFVPPTKNWNKSVPPKYLGFFCSKNIHFSTIKARNKCNTTRLSQATHIAWSSAALTTIFSKLPV